MKSLVALPSSSYKLKGLVKLNVTHNSKLESLPEEIADLEKLEELDASYTLISQPPSSIVWLNKIKLLSFAKQESEDRVYFVYLRVNEGFFSLEKLDLSDCNLIDGGLPEDIRSLSSLKELNLDGNNFEHLPRSIAQLGSLQTLRLSYCERLTQLPEFPQQLDIINAHWSNDSICNSLFQNISSFQHDICDSHSLSLRVFTTRGNIPRWFHHQEGGRSLSVKLPENWYVSDNFLRLVLSNHRKEYPESGIQFFLVPLTGLLDKSKSNEKIPNDYELIRLFSTGEMEEFGLRLLYKDEPELGALLQMRRYDSSEHHDSATSCSSSEKQRSHF